ncbi:YoaK family protein [Deinococcus pimensis]|uniref:YoaK family protein n=1 Tax=Deinococcus pimensis TaxID=309888 RepID=UPI0004B8B8C6|nr:YoaK family protein [Deinococcus pimensis]
MASSPTPSIRPAAPARATTTLALLLASVAGYVDAVGFVTLSGLFVSFMSGNTSTTGVLLGQGQWRAGAQAALPIPLFVLGVLLGALITRSSRRGPALTLITAALLLLGFLIASSFWSSPTERHDGWTWAVMVALLVLPMGMQNAALRRVGSQSVGLTYVTGTLAALGEHLAAWLTRQDHAATSDARLVASLWCCFAGGAILGSYVAHHWTSWALVLPMLALTGAARYMALHPSATSAA